MAAEGRRIELTGTVQGVGLRPLIYRLARAAGLSGRVRNDGAGVTIEAFGDRGALESFVERLAAERPEAARFHDLRCTAIPGEAACGFEIVPSAAAEGERRLSIPPDLATCPECLRELDDAADRRHRYAFTNCTACGPRYTIARDVPYDRPATTMAAFRMCAECAREYVDPADRRFHAQPNACPRCGPRLELLAADGAPLPGEDPIAAAAAALRDGLVVAVKGLGGFHLACDAGSETAVARLRERKRREEKPLAVMAPDLLAAGALVVLGDEERRLLTGPDRPIVLAPRRPGAAVAAGVAPETGLLGVLLPYTPLHHLLARAAGRPLVMTSGNLSDEPIACRNDEALARLRGVADRFVVHDREIENRLDDSVVRVVAGAPVVLRRSRGRVPRAVALARRLAGPVLACGANLKNAVCIGAGEAAWLGPHVGDLDGLPAYDFFVEAVEKLERLLGVRPEVVAHDLHPGFASTRYAQERPAAMRVAVQHHHGHVASAMAEHGLEGPVLGIAYDGTGLGTDGCAWGGELLLADLGGFSRLATFRPIPLPGGDQAVHEPWRAALSIVLDACGGDAPLDRLRLFRAAPGRDVRVVRRMLESGTRCPPAHGVGRWFDAVGALVLCRARAGYEGQVAAALEQVADPGERGRYAFELDVGASPWVVDLRPMVRAIVGDLLAGRDAGVVAARFHETIAAATAEAVRAAARRTGPLPVVATGGCFQNARLAEGVRRSLAPALAVHLHREVPPGDGGVALGQVLVADAFSRGEAKSPCA